MELSKNRVLPLEITGYSSDGAGVARADGMVVFIPGTIRGELWEVRILKVTARAAWGKGERLLRAAPTRRDPGCPHYGPCGGCQLRHMDYAEELYAKRQRVEDALRRIGGADISVSVIHGAKNTDRYRNKVQMPVAQGAIGCYQARSHRVVDTPDCLLQPEPAAACRQAVKDWMEQFRVPAYDERDHSGLIRHLYLRFNRAGEALCCLVVNGRSVPRADRLAAALRRAVPTLTGLVLNTNDQPTNVILGDRCRTLWGRDYLEEELCGLTFRLSVPSFFQVDRDQAEVLYGLAAEYAGLTGTETVLDLYCGTGTIGLTMARRAGQVIGAEIVPQAVEDARMNAQRNGIGNARFLCADAGEAAAQLAAEGLRPQVIVVDPPRKGLSPQTVNAVCAMAPERLVYVSCDPGTLARDVKLLSQQGWHLVRAEAVDMFPRTSHIETAALLSHE